MSNPLRSALLAALAALVALALPGVAAAAPQLTLDLHHEPTNFIPGGDRAAASIATATTTDGAPTVPVATDEVQTVRVAATYGSFQLSFDPDGAGPQPPQATSDLPVLSSAAAVQAALAALPAIGAGNVSVTDNINPPDGRANDVTYTVTFVGALAGTDSPQLGAQSSATDPLRIDPEYWIDIDNVGPDPTSGPITLTVVLPAGLSRREVAAHVNTNGAPAKGAPWSCPGSVGDTTIVCTGTGSIPRHTVSRGLVVRVDVAPTLAEGTVKTVQAKVQGGGAAAPDNAKEPTPISSAPAPFAILPGTFVPDFFAADGRTLDRAAGSRPDLFTVPFDLATVDAPDAINLEWKEPPGSLRNVHVDTPPGFLGNPTAVGECPQADLPIGACPASSQVGRLGTTLVDLGHGGATGNYYQYFDRPVYNMVHPLGVVSDLGFVIGGNPVHIRASLDPAHGYEITTKVPDVNETLPPYDSKLTLWGVPADPAHDSERCGALGLGSLGTESECASDAAVKPFLTVPFRCDADISMRAHDYDSWQDSGNFGPDLTYTLPGHLSGCDQIPFAPSVSVAPSTDAADSPSGLDVGIELPQHEDCQQIVPAPPAGQIQYHCETATSPLKDATIALPQGLTVNPASANGLSACSEAQISLGTNDPVSCPDASQIASVQLTTPALPDPVQGLVFLATPYENPFDSLLAGYIVLADPDRGLLIKIPGKITADPETGQLSGTFKDNPQLPFSHLALHFQGGAYATLITPKTCGDYTSNADFAPWSGNADVQPTAAFTIAHAAAGGDCPASEGDQPNSPGFDGGPVSPVSKSYGPFELHLRREDGSQRFGAFKVTLPQGLTGRLAGTALCPEAALAAAAQRSGKDEQSDPSCPPDSHVGIVQAAVGAGPSPYYAHGDAYLSGPYKGAPVSLAVITPAVAGPFDLGTIVIRTPLQIDPATAQITALSDPIPQMLQGIPTDVRSVDVLLDRPDFTLTGTSCDPASLEGLLTSTLGHSAPFSVRYQLSDCTRLPFKPKISLRLRGSTARTGNPALTATLTPRPGDANIASVSVALPPSEFLDNAHIGTVCTRVQFAAEGCPSNSIYGEATVTTPLLDDPLTGHVYLRSSENPLPDLVPDLRGPASLPIKLEAAGRTDSFHRGLRNSFEFVPDAPFSKFVLRLPGAAKGLIENSRDLCAKTYRATVKYTAHNGLAYVDHPKLGVSCKKAKKHHKRHNLGHRRHHRGSHR